MSIITINYVVAVIDENNNPIDNLTCHVRFRDGVLTMFELQEELVDETLGLFEERYDVVKKTCEYKLLTT